MAFNVKKNKRLPAQDDGVTEVETGEDTDIIVQPESNPFGMQENKSNVVATQSWVWQVIKKVWGWTKFFATESAQVAGGLTAGRIKTNELQSGDIYAQKIVLLDPDGKPAVLHINGSGELKIDYDYQDVFIYPGDLDIRNYVYRYGTKPENMATNFVGLTPYETLLNFIPYQSNETRELNGKNCQKICAADGMEELLGPTLMITCSKLKKIVSVHVLDADGNDVPGKGFDLPSGTYRKLTINLPCFKSPDGLFTEHVNLPGKYAWEGPGALVPFMPPFLLPPAPSYLVPPAKPTVPAGPYPSSLNNDIFIDNTIADDGLFDNIQDGVVQEETEPYPDQQFGVGQDYEVVYEDYTTSTYCNIVLKRDFFDKNKEQYLVIDTEDV